MMARRRGLVDYLAGNGPAPGICYGRSMKNAAPVGHSLRQWRQRRHLSQLALACDADISTRHLSFVETGRSAPSRDMVLHLAERLDVPLRERNNLLVAAGYAPVFPERPLSDPALDSARKAVELVLEGHEPYPALAIDRRWTLLPANRTAMRLLGGVDAALLAAADQRASREPASIRTRRPESPTSRNGARTSCRACGGKSTSPPIACSTSSSPRSRATDRRIARRTQRLTTMAGSSFRFPAQNAERRPELLFDDDRVRHAGGRHPV